MENLKLVGDQSDVPEDYELVESEDISTFLESDYGELRSLVRKAIKDGTIRLTRKAEVEKKKVNDLRLSDISNRLGSHWVCLARELDIEDVDINLIREEYPDNLRLQVLVMLRLWRNTEGNKATANALEKALRECERKDIVNKIEESVVNKIEESVAQTQLDQSSFEAFKAEISPKRGPTFSDDYSIDVIYDEQDFLNQVKGLCFCAISKNLDYYWVELAKELDIEDVDINLIRSQYFYLLDQALVMLRLWRKTKGNKATANALENALRKCDRKDLINKIEESVVNKYSIYESYDDQDVFSQVKDLRLSDISKQLGSDWVPLARELDIEDEDINLIRCEYPDNLCLQALVMLRFWRNTEGNKATGNALKKALRECDRELSQFFLISPFKDLVNKIEESVEQNKIEESVAQTQLDQSCFDAFKAELGPSRNSTLKSDYSIDVSHDEQDVFNQDSPEKMSTVDLKDVVSQFSHADIFSLKAYKLLRKAIDDENLDNLKLLVEAGVKPDQEDQWGCSRSLLHKAAERRAFLKGNGQWNIYGFKLLQKAVMDGDLDKVKLLVEAGVNPNQDYLFGYTPLHKAAEIRCFMTAKGQMDKGYLEMVKYLHSHGAKIDIEQSGPGDNRFTPLWRAAYSGDLPLVEYLANNGANIDKPFGWPSLNPLTAAADNGHVEVVKFLIEKGADVDKKCEKYYRKVGLSCWEIVRDKLERPHLLKEVMIQNYEEIVQLLKDAGAKEPWMTALDLKDVDIEGREGMDLLHNAVEDRDIYKVKLLVKAGANPQKEDVFGVDLLHNAAANGYLGTVKLLVEAGASPDKRDNCGYSHLHTAAEKGHLEIVKYLHSQGAKIQTRDSQERLTPLWRAAYYGDLPMVEYLANNGADIEEPEAWFSLFPLNAAVYNGHVEVVKFLIEKGADVDKQTGDKSSLSNLEIAMDKFKNNVMPNYGNRKEEYEAIIKLLKDAGATELNQEAVNKIVGDTFRAMYGSGPNCDSITSKLQKVYNQEGTYRMMMKSFFDIIPLDDPLGPIAIGLMLNNCSKDMEEYLRLLEMKGDESVHRKICLILSVVAHRKSYDITPEMLDYLFGNLQPGTHPETMLYSMLALESFSFGEFQPDKNRKLVNERFSQFPPSEHPVVQIEKKMKDSKDWVEQQVAFCAEWLLDNVWGNDDLEKVRSRRETNGTNVNAKVVYCNSHNRKCLKIGQNGLEASCGPAFNFQTVMSTVAVDVGCWYYEVTIFSEGIMQIGWASKQAEFVILRYYGDLWCGDDEFGESFDGCRQLIWYKKEQKKPTYAEECIKWKSGDVVGALIDIENQEIVISVNGVAVSPEPMKELFKKVTDGFFAAVSLMGFQHCQFNFGNVPFKHSPEGRSFKPLNEATSINEAISINKK